MKTMVNLAVLLATLLLLTGVAFAGSNCHDYEFHFTSLDDPGYTGIWCVELCFYYGDNSGIFSGFCDQAGNIVLFFDSINEQAVWHSTSDPSVGFLKFHGDDLYIFTGIEYCGWGERFEYKGHKVDDCIMR